MPITITLDDHGNPILPREILEEYGFVQGGATLLETTEQGLLLTRSPSSLARIYLEPTNTCNLTCSTCIRNVWEEPPGWMTWQTYERIISGVQSFNPAPTLFFGGMGEPLAHPQIHEMIYKAHEAGIVVDLITNGILLDENTARWMVDLEVRRVWVSIDGSTPGSYFDIRLGDTLPLVVDNLTRFKSIRDRSGLDATKLGVAFVAMKRNIADFPQVVRLGKRLGADLFSVTNVLPYSAELNAEVLFNTAICLDNFGPTRWSPSVSLPRMDHQAMFFKHLPEAMKHLITLQLARQPLKLGFDTCPFVEKGSVSIRWDGGVSPCIPLLHTHSSYLDHKLRTSQAYFVGNIREQSLMELWNDPSYTRLRQRLNVFDFSPCVFCNSCEMSEANLEDCYGNEFPTCGGCLWAQGFIQCP